MTRIQLKRGSTSDWSAADLANRVLAAGEIGLNTDDYTFKIGDGVKKYSLLGYANSGIKTATPQQMTISNAFTNSGSFDGSSAFTLDLPSTISRNISGLAGTATALATPRNINGTAFNGTAPIVVGGAVYGTAATTSASFSNIYVSPSGSAPSSPNNGDVWIAW
jgi:hypothetical protein